MSNILIQQQLFIDYLLIKDELNSFKILYTYFNVMDCPQSKLFPPFLKLRNQVQLVQLMQ